MQPFMTSITLSSELSTKIFSSIPTSPNSFSITANFILCSVLDRIWLSSVVFPDPRNPVNTVTGILRFCTFKAPYLSLRGMGRYLTSTNNFMASNYLSKSMVTINQMLIYRSKPSIRSSFKIVGQPDVGLRKCVVGNISLSLQTQTLFKGYPLYGRKMKCPLR